jgi:hypothetical protein
MALLGRISEMRESVSALVVYSHEMFCCQKSEDSLNFEWSFGMCIEIRVNDIVTDSLIDRYSVYS